MTPAKEPDTEEPDTQDSDKSHHSVLPTYAAARIETIWLLSKVRAFVLQGWPSHLQGEEFKPFVRRKDELSVNDHVVLWGNRVIVPPKSRLKVIEVLYSMHPGVSRMKSLARSYVWWLGMDAEI